ncbi:MAG: translation elongation factor Ts [Bdellovibrionales bacterium]|nr:translation elongation factor Ts [Bdellovibrionales bacterium]
MKITAADVNKLRQLTGAGMMDCKKALTEANGDMEKAVEVLRKMGLKDVAKREGKVAAEGTIGTYSHAGDQIVAIVELNCETDFVARGDEFKDVARGLAMHVAAMGPIYVNIDDVPEEILAKEKEILMETLNEKQKEMADKILPGKLSKFYEDSVLVCQKYVRDDSKTVQTIIEELSARCGEKVTLRRFERFQVGEGIEKKQENLADEVAATIAGS